MADGILDLAPFDDMVPRDVQDEINAAKQEIISRDLHPFNGPIHDNNAVLKVTGGETMTDYALISFDWLVEGVVVKSPSSTRDTGRPDRSPAPEWRPYQVPVNKRPVSTGAVHASIGRAAQNRAAALAYGP